MSKCAAIQMASSPNISFNLLEAEKLIAEAVKAGAKLVALPENFALMGDHESDKLKAKEVDGSGPIQNFLATVAKKYAVWVVGGTIPMAADDSNKARAACLIYNDKGERVGRYDKIHLFDVNVPGTNEVYRESDSIEPGTESLVVRYAFWQVGYRCLLRSAVSRVFSRNEQEGRGNTGGSFCIHRRNRRRTLGIITARACRGKSLLRDCAESGWFSS